MESYEVTFLKAIMNKEYDEAEEALKKLSIIEDLDSESVLFSLKLAGDLTLEGEKLVQFLNNFKEFGDLFIKEH
ncbi:hypothetical protein FP435_04680 [Lactobacillus sp. PV037]|uniref:hypothetical protein n=1 Tax=Lactobacillus sp. PV037 TaxID=2594496 RepID=UPI00223FCCA6|nr:hypothetical protein [Lactobacillus sp. PV037]QNQ83787.1 hypothetical protein FP435_04680 [Lactobacillus sp. PV037]